MKTPDYKIMVGDNRQSLRTLEPNSVDAIVTDPPYELGFMGKGWDKTGIANDVKFWDDCLRVLKPGGHLVAFSGSRTYHRMVCAIEDAGFEVRDQMMWVYGSGFPKSHNISKAIDKAAGAEREVLNETTNRCGFDPVAEGGGGFKRGTIQVTAPATDAAKQWDGWGTALKPAHEPIVLARKPLEGTVADNVLKWGVGGLNIDACRVGTETVNTLHTKRPSGDSVVGKKIISTGEVTTHQGRFPANLMHDGSKEVLDLFPETKSGELKGYKSGGGSNGHLSGKDAKTYTHSTASSGSAARFFYCPKASKKDRDEGCEGMEEVRESDRAKDDGVGGDNPRNRTNNARRNFHPTVKPTELMAYLCRLVTPPAGIILDPFMGSGSTGKAAIREGFRFIGMELSQEYADIAAARIAHEEGKAK